MRKFLLLFFAFACVQLSAWAAITISTASVSVGGTTYSGYGIYGAQEGELAQLLNGNYEGISNATLNQLKSAEYIKVGSSSNPNVLGDADLAALELLSAAKFLDIDGSTLASGANIASIKAGSAIEAVTLPNGLSKAQVNAAGAALTECNEDFGSCLSLNAEMETVEKTFYPYTIGGVDYNADFSDLTDNGDGTYTYHVTSVERDLTNAEGYPVLTYENTDLNHMAFTTNEGEIVMTDMGGWQRKDVKVSKFGVKVQGSAGSYYYVNPFTGDNVPIADESNIQTAQGNTFIIVDFSPNYKTYPMQGNGRFKYQYLDLDGVTVVETQETQSPDDDMKITLQCDETVTITPETRTVTQPVEGGDCEVIAYVNKAGSLYKATSLDANDVLSATSVVISGNINNGDISQGGYSGSSCDDPQYNQGDADKFEHNDAIPAFAFNNTGAQIKSVDLSDADVANYKHLRMLNAYGANLVSVVFPKGVTRIPNYCCYSDVNNVQNLANVVFPTAAESFTIGDYAFHGTAIRDLVLPSTVTMVGDYAFKKCPNLYSVEMEGLTQTCHFGNNVFEQCKALQHVSLSEGVENIGDYMFNQCVILESIRIPSTCKTIGSYAFQFCYDIHQVTIPEGVELIKYNAFEGAGLTDLYIMATSIDKIPKIYAMSTNPETNGGPSTFSYQRTTGNNTIPANHRDDLEKADYDEVMTWYQEEQSGPQGLGSGNCLTALHYPESMKPFYEAIDVTKFYSAEELANIPFWQNPEAQQTVKKYYTPDEYLAMSADPTTLTAVVNNVMQEGYDHSYVSPTDFGTDENGNPILYQYLPQSYAVDPRQDGSTTKVFGPDKDGRYYPSQTSYQLRMAAGATGTQAGGVAGEEVASAWGWRQFPLSSSIESIGEIPFEKEYDDTWYTMCFPWRMIDNQLFAAFNQKMEIVEFVGAEVLDVDNPSTENVKEYSLVFHFDDVAATYYMDQEDNVYKRDLEVIRQITVGDVTINKKFYKYTLLDGDGNQTSTVITDPYPYDPSSASKDDRERHVKYLSIENIMVLAGHPYMIHPSIGASPGNPTKVYINGVKKIVPGEGLYEGYSSLEAVAEARKTVKTVSSRTRTRTHNDDGTVTDTYSGAETWTHPETGGGGKYYFIGNINDAKETNGVSDGGKKDLPKGCYYLGLPLDGSKYPKYYKRKSVGTNLWSQYSAIILPDEDALRNVESLNVKTVATPAGGQAKGASMEIGAWDFNDTAIVNDIEMASILEDAKEKSANIMHMNVVYNIKGQVVRPDSGSVEGLPKGIYIVNGKKYMVK